MDGAITRFRVCNIAHVSAKMTSPTPKGNEKEKDIEAEVSQDLTEAQRLKRSFERSLAGPSVGKAGLIRDQTGGFGGGSIVGRGANWQRSIESLPKPRRYVRCQIRLRQRT